jgi:hypothetical protein
MRKQNLSSRRRTGALCVLLAAAACKPRNDSNLANSESAGSIFDPWIPDIVSQIPMEKVFPKKFGFGTKLFGITPVDWGQISGKYAYQVRPIESQGAYLRTDSWRLSSALNAGDILLGAANQSLPIGLSFSLNGQIEYSRIFDSRIDALKALAKTPLDLPTSAAAARRLAPGDFVSMPVNMGIHLGISTNNPSSTVAASASTGVFWVGEFRINVYRHDGDLVRVKLSPSHEFGRFGSVSSQLQLNAFGYDPVTGLVNLDNQVEKLLGLNFFQLTERRVWASERFTADYIFNLASPEAADLLDRLLNQPQRLRAAWAQLLPENLGGKPFLDLAPVERIVLADAALPAEQRRIERLISGVANGGGRTLSFRLGTRLLRATGERQLMFHELQTTDVDGTEHRFLYPLYRHNRRTDSWLTPLKASDQISMSTAVRLDPNGKSARGVSLVMARNIRQRKIQAIEANKLRADMDALFGIGRFHQALAPYLPESGSYSAFELNLRLGWDDRIFAQWARLASVDPDGFERRLWRTIANITPQLQGRSGAGSAAAATSPLQIPEYIWSKSLQEVQRTLRSAVNLRWDSIRGRVAQELVTATTGLGKSGAAPFVLELMRILATDFSAEEIIPAFLFELSEQLQTPAYSQLRVIRNGQSEKVFEQGQLQQMELQSDLAEKFRLVTHMGFELSGIPQ